MDAGPRKVARGLERRALGRTGLVVSRMCFGTLTMGPLQAKLPVEEGALLLRAALDAGVNFIDTAELYNTYDYIREAVFGGNGARSWSRDTLVIASKSYDYTYEGMRETVERALRSLGTDYIDIFLLHEQESALTLKGHEEALKYLVFAREAGKVRAVGVSTHHVACVRAATLMPEIDVIHPLLNRSGIGIADGSASEMLAAVRDAHLAGKGIYSMKALGGGALLDDVEGALRWALGQECVDSIAVGVKTLDELRMDLAIFEGQHPDDELRERTRHNKALLIEPWCTGCGTCVARCTHGALAISPTSGRATVDTSRCVLCGYCQAACPEFCIKVV
ncbi:MAG TPA: 4Fe-4S binding protein [Firmicutes bacterium]|nr:4Fe-4S binding protein [Bacillota bacterium]